MGFMSLTLAKCPLFINSKKKIDRYGAEPIIGTYSFSKTSKMKERNYTMYSRRYVRNS